MIFALALIPVIGLLIFIYVRDKREKEPMGLLIGLFFAGLGTAITAIILETIGELILNAVIPYESAIKAVLLAMIVVGPAEEMGKYTVLRLITWKNKHFDYSYDAIVYAVFASLGFAAIENIGYVFDGGLSVALMRMFTAIPGHTSFAVFMGFFYSKAKFASVTGNTSDYKKYNALSMIMPIIIHGLYDAIVMGGLASGADIVLGLAFLLWIVYVIALFVVSFIMVIKASKNDFCIVTLPGAFQTVYNPAFLGPWTCGCGTINQLNFCATCGSQRPFVENWTCPQCGTLSAFNFCGRCGFPKPQMPPMMPQQMQPQQAPQMYSQMQPQMNPQGYPQMQPQMNPQGYPQMQPQPAPQMNPQGYPQMQPQMNPQPYPQAAPQIDPQNNQNNMMQ